jgi:tetratricopeptide (TPR) repeat protein
MQNYPDAHTAYGISISHDGNNARAYFGKGHVYDLQSDAAEAEENYRKAITLDSSLVEAHSGLGRVLTGQNRLDEAANEFKVVYDAAVNKRVKAEAAYSLGQIYRSQGKLIEAQKFAEEATVIDPIYPLAWYGAGAVYYSQAIDSKSTDTIEERTSLLQKSTVMMNNAIGLNENQSAAYLQLAINFSLIGKFDVCFEALDKAQTVVLSDITLTTKEKGEMIKRVQSVRDSLKVISETPLPAKS